MWPGLSLTESTVHGNRVALALQSALNSADATTITLTARIDEEFYAASASKTAVVSSDGLDVDPEDNVDSASVLAYGVTLNNYLLTVQKTY